MGKANRIRANRVHNDVMTLDTKPQKKGMPSWLMTVIAIVVTLAILLSVVGLLMASNGVFGRWATAISTKHFKVNANMLSYFYYTNYQEFLNSNSDNLAVYGLDTSKSLKEQYVGGEEAAEDEDAMTWFDYFMDQTVSSVSNLLVYCEGAYELDIELEDEDYEQIDANIDALLSSAEQYMGFYANTNSYISDVYGAGVKEKDIRKAMEYSMLANKYIAECSSILSDEITDEDVKEAYEADPQKYLLVDYSYYTFETSYTEAKKAAGYAEKADSELSDEQKQEIADEYAKLVAKVKSDVASFNQFNDKSDVKDVNKFIIRQIAVKEVDTAWDMIDEENEELKTIIDNKVLIKAALVGDISEEILAGATEPEKAEKEKGAVAIAIKNLNLDEKNLSQLNTVKNTAFGEVLGEKAMYIFEKATKESITEHDVSHWIFEDEAKLGDKKQIAAEKNSEKSESGSTYAISVYFLAKAPYLDTEITRNIAYMLFTSEDAAKAAVDAMMNGEISSLADFEAIADEFEADAHTHLEDYVKGSLQSNTFDTWLYAEETKVGSYTEAPLKLEDGATYCVAFYYEEGHEAWYVSVKNAVLSERLDEKLAELQESIEVNVKEKTLDRVDA